MSISIDTAIIGAGPYGLSLAAHLSGKVPYRIFGSPMGTWKDHMPSGMCLKSDGFACDLYDPARQFTLRDYCRTQGIPYQDRGLPVHLQTFTSYGLAFQRQFVPDLDPRFVSNVCRDEAGFRLTLNDGDIFWARRVVVAAGLTNFAVMPEVLARLPKKFVAHSSEYQALGDASGRDVLVIGAGASAVDVALSLHDAGARATLVTRRSAVAFHAKAPEKRSMLTRIKNPWSGLGPGWRSRLACDLPLVFHCLPAELRIKIATKHLGPAPGWFTAAEFLGRVDYRVGLYIKSASAIDGKVQVVFGDQAGKDHEFLVDQVVSATGYRVDVSRLSFLDRRLAEEVRTEQNGPVLSTSFESSVPELYFTGPSAAYSFGPLLRFAFGARFASRRLATHLSARARRTKTQTATPSLFYTSPSSGPAPFAEDSSSFVSSET